MVLYILAFLPVIILIIIFVLVAHASQNKEDKNNMSLKKAYLYLVSVISLIIAVIGAIMLINLALKAWVFPKADQNYYYSQPCPVAVDKTATSTGCDQVSLDEQKKINDENRTSQRQNTAAQAIAMILVATPVWFYHWKLAKKEV